MGRHALGASRSRVSFAAGGWAAAALAVVAVGWWLGSGVQPSPMSTPETRSAVVVSSLACTDGADGTIVEVLSPAGSLAGPVRAGLDACGYQEGEQLLVRYMPGDPAQVVLSGNESSTELNSDRLLPLGLTFAALFALGAVIAVWLDGRRARARGGRVVQRRSAAHQVVEADPWPPAGDLVLVGSASAALSAFGVPERAAQSAHVALSPLGTASLGTPPPVTPGPTGRHAMQNEPAVLDVDHLGRPERGLSTVDLTFPFSSGLAACLHDELFTHRGQPG